MPELEYKRLADGRFVITKLTTSANLALTPSQVLELDKLIQTMKQEIETGTK